LNQVQAISKKSKTLDELGKKTLSQATTLLDLGESGLPVLTKWVTNPQKDWRVRYWATDMCGYVGNSKTEGTLLLLVKNEKEKKAIRLRALDSLAEIQNRSRQGSEKILKTLGVRLKKAKDPELKNKISWTMNQIRKS